MTHADDDGLVLPPRIASAHVVLLPIFRSDDERERVLTYTERLAADLRKVRYHDVPVQVEIDARDIGGARGWEWIKKGIPLRVEIGPKDIDKDALFVGRRDQDPRKKASIPRALFMQDFTAIMDDMQQHLYAQALAFRETHTRRIDKLEDFNAFFTPRSAEKPEIHGGFALSHWCGDARCEQRIKDALNVTIRCIPLENDPESGHCVSCGGPSGGRVIWAKAY
jgi:prolyl-tRNA synthetase